MPNKSPSQFVSELLEKLAGTSRHVAFLLGAGTSKAVGLPDVPELGKKVGEGIASRNKALGQTYDKILEERKNIEGALSWVRSIASILQVSTASDFQGIDAKTAAALDKEICGSIARIVSQDPSAGFQVHRSFAGWLGRSEHRLPVEVFTLNYDLLIERGLELAGVPYFDGFAGVFEGRFRTDLVDSAESGSTGRLEVPPGWVRVWKLHGSISWRIKYRPGTAGGNAYISRVGSALPPESDQEMLAIYPSEEKYQESRRLPFTALFDRFRRSLAVPESLTIVSGYSFLDQDVNEIIFDAVERFPRSEVVALFFSDIPEVVAARAKTSPNLSVAGAKLAVLSGQQCEWQAEDIERSFWKAGDFRLGDFRCLVETLVGGREPSQPGTPADAI
jgi:hypothetical protein